MMMTTGRCSPRVSRWVVWMSEREPKPSIPRIAVAPARPWRWARCTISTYTGRWCHWSASSTRMVSRWAVPWRRMWPAPAFLGAGKGLDRRRDDGQDGDERDEHVGQVRVEPAGLQSFDDTHQREGWAAQRLVQVLLHDFDDVGGVAKVDAGGAAPLVADPTAGGRLHRDQFVAGHEQRGEDLAGGMGVAERGVLVGALHPGGGRTPGRYPPHLHHAAAAEQQDGEHGGGEQHRHHDP